MHTRDREFYLDVSSDLGMNLFRGNFHKVARLPRDILLHSLERATPLSTA